MAVFPQSEEINICMNKHVLNVLWALVSIAQTESLSKIAVHLKSVCFTVYRLNHLPIPCFFFIVTILITTKVV